MKAITAQPRRITTLAARAAEASPAMPIVLGVSLWLATSMMSLAWILPALYG